ncbi:glycoside hydrolase family 73 protein [Limosilactobacillus oris]|uniref:glycoside hydrolase family 73 protein n=1 Tax=Limosilactobacillus oris TaxID=1632 RepID=UPI0021B3AAAE|nr:glycoside hydrolase family 73 protein [Limosilactobacillus oris]UXC67241.1 glycoside hydrolase family 73 protein [Limosilactobacillus oris]
MKNKKQSRVKIVLPVLFTFGASLLFFQADAQADSSQSADANAQVVATTDANTQNNNYQSLNLSTSQNQSVASAQVYTQSAVAANQNNNSSTNKDGAVSLSDSTIQAAANKPVVETNPGYSTNQYNVTAQPVNAANGGSGAASLNTAGLTAAQKAFLDSIHDGAISTWKQYGVLPSLTAAQAIIESGWGQSSLASQYHNLFGIKGSYNGHSVTLPTREVYGGQSVIINDSFRAYDNNSQSVQDHGYFLVANSRYHNLLWKTNYRDVTYLIRADGYATDPSYTTTLNSVIERYGLTAWDQEAFDVNTGYIDDLSVRGNQLHIAGWHAANSYNSNMHHFIILLDGNGHELYRTEVAGVYRPDVQNLYSNADIAGWGGFDITIPYTNNFAGQNIQVVSRYTYDGNGEINGGKDLYFNPVSLNANAGFLDNMSLDAKTGNLNISGWHAADASLNKNYHYIIIYDGSKQTELGRYLVKNSTRNDVANVYPGIYNAAESGFSLKLKFNQALAGDQIQIISRYSSSKDGNSDYVDYWFAPKTFTANEACLDNYSIQGDSLNVSGWHAADQSVGKKYHYVIVYDATKHQEITRRLVPSSSRGDVERAYSNVYGSDNSGFSINIPLTSAMTNGDQIQIISRYSDSQNGEGNYVDYWFAPKTFTANKAYLDNFAIKGQQVQIAGWHAADQSVGRPYHYVILFDATTGREVKRQLVQAIARPDVAKVNGDVYNAGQSGFNLTMTVDSSLSGHNLQAISRYSDSKSGEGHYIDYWFKPVNVTIK